MSRSLELYRTVVSQQLRETFGLNNPLQVPRITKIVLNMGLGSYLKKGGRLEDAQHELTMLAGQKAAVTYFKKSIAGFKIRDGSPAGLKVTLRGRRLFEFLDRLIYVALPRSRDFMGLRSKSMDGHGAISLGIRECSVFPELKQGKERLGMDITIVTTSQESEHLKALLQGLKLPFYA
jgi:large subunit ribosomal protein L5